MSKYHHSYTFGSSAIFFVRQPSDFNSTLSCARSKKAKSASVCPHPFRVYFPIGSPFGAEAVLVSRSDFITASVELSERKQPARLGRTRTAIVAPWIERRLDGRQYLRVASLVITAAPQSAALSSLIR